MTLLEALQTINRSRSSAAPVKSVFLGCGFTPLHLETFLHAGLQRRFPEARIEIQGSLYGDLAGSIERVPTETLDAAAVVIEWADLDARLGIRQLGGWQPEIFPDILSSARLSLERLEAGLTGLARGRPVALSVPTLPLPPLDLPAGWQEGMLELDLREDLAKFAARASRIRGVRVLNSQRLDALSPLSRRRDAKSELLTGFPYSLEHAEKFADLLAALMQNPPPKKGLITDLDDTCWKGILGEVGVDGIGWALDGHAQIYGLYQQFLHALASRGVLVGAASKNDPGLVAQAFRRPDIVLPANRVFPVEASWTPKSESVARILEVWNVGPDAVVFVDDSPMELAEVQTAQPNIECLLFPKHDPGAVLALLDRLRDLFGKPSISEEDRIRSQSIRRAEVFRHAGPKRNASYEEVLRQAEANINFHSGDAGDNPRAFELINKTNQFNLNGKRYTESEWQGYFRQQGAFLLTASYKDKFGPLGEIAAILGRTQTRETLRVDAWVMSCRAFSRRIEHQCVRYMFQKFAAGKLVFEWAETPRNGPLREFLSSFGRLQPEFCLSRDRFDSLCPPLFHSLMETTRE